MSAPVGTDRGEFVLHDVLRKISQEGPTRRPNASTLAVDDAAGNRVALVELTSVDGSIAHLKRMRMMMAGPAAVRLALAVMELVKTGGARQVAPGARITLAPGDWDRLTLLAHEAAKALEGRS